MVKKGDTLIEVTIAIGIFSMIAIAVAAVMSGGTASSQLALETTLAREEIDNQAEAIRFIHTAYTANKDNEDHPYAALWRSITNRAIDIRDFEDNENKIKEILQYTPSSCSDLYSDETILSSAFVINAREFNQLNTNVGSGTGFANLVFFPYNNTNKSKFTTAATYPRLIYGTNTGDDSTAILADDSFPTTLKRVEGIYVVPVVDPETTSLVDVIDAEEVKNTPAYYDFYIRTCWYGSRTDDPSTISTVIRLHDPDAVFAGGFFDVKYSGYDPDYSEINRNIHDRNNIRKEELPEPTKYGWEYDGWCEKNHYHEDTNTCDSGYEYKGKLINPGKNHRVYDLVPVWKHIEFKFRYDLSGGDSDVIRQYNETNPTTTICYLDEDTCRALTVRLNYPPDPYKMGGRFSGWCLLGNVNDDGFCTGANSSIVDAGGRIDNTKLLEYSPNAPHIIILKATWNRWNESYKAVLTWDAQPRDIDSHVRGQKSNGVPFHTYYAHKVDSDLDPTITLADLDRDITRGYGPETMIFNTLGGLNYYYFVYCYAADWPSNCSNVPNATVVFERKGHNETTYSPLATLHSDDAVGTGRLWLIFANRNGKITFCNRRTDDNVNLKRFVDYDASVADSYFNTYCPEE